MCNDDAYTPHKARQALALAGAEAGFEAPATMHRLNLRSMDIAEHHQELLLESPRGEAEKVARSLLGKAQAEAEAA